MKLRHKKNKGMTIIESVVSGSIMVGVVVLSFQTMLTGAQLSQKSTATNDLSNGTRAAMNQLTSDIRKAEKVIQDYKQGSIDGLSQVDKITLRVPKFNPAGRKIAGQWQIINYVLKPVADGKGPYNLIRTTGNVNGNSSPNDVVSTNIATNISELKFDYFLSQNIPVSGNIGTFPGSITFTTPVGNKMRIFAIKAPWASINLKDSDDGVIGNGVSAVSLAMAGLTVLGSGTVTPTAPAGSKIDILFQVATDQTKDADNAILANQINIKLVAKELMSDGTNKILTFEDTPVLANN